MVVSMPNAGNIAYSSTTGELLIQYETIESQHVRAIAGIAGRKYYVLHHNRNVPG